MRFNPRARVDGSQIDDRTGGGGFGGGSLGGGGFGGGSLGGGGMPGIRVGGGIGGFVVAVIIALIYTFANSGGATTGPAGAGASQGSGSFGTCTGAEAQQDRDCRLEFITASVQDFWSRQLPRETGRRYEEIRTVPFTQSVTTDGCGTASSEAGPFYCPNDRRVYLDLSFFDSIFSRLGGRDTAFTEAYVVAHEYSHHIQNLLGLLSRVRTQQGPDSDSVRLETMADCLAGVWTKSATTTKDAQGNVLITDLTDADIRGGIAAAKVVGDDAIQARTSGRVSPEGWTHGSSAQRVAAFQVGLSQGSIKACDFFDPQNDNYPRS